MLANSQINTLLDENRRLSKINDDVINTNIGILEYFKEQNNVNFSVNEEVYTLNTLDAESLFSIAIETGFLNEKDKEMIMQLADNIRVFGFHGAINEFKDELVLREMSNTKFEKFNLLVNSLTLMNDLDPTVFQTMSMTNAREADNTDCIIASVGFACACIGLLSLTAASGGLATGAAVVGYVAASASLTRAC